MIIVFHYLSHLIYKIYKRHFQDEDTKFHFTLTTLTKTDSALTTISHPLAELDLEHSIKFDPPVYKQRYERVIHILNDDKWKNNVKKVVDFGCAEFGLWLFLKHYAKGVNHVNFVDVDENLLKEYLFRLYPLNNDFFTPRTDPLQLQVFKGSLADPDPSLVNSDAVIGIEVIEHLYPDVLEALPYNVFSFINPKIAIFTTPNVEFNVYFPQLKKFRHADHKFEWTREQFESWAKNIAIRFPKYSVSFDGIGLGLTGKEKEGCCSQLAVFVRKDIYCDKTTNNLAEENSCLDKKSFGICTYNSLSLSNSNNPINPDEETYYELITTVEYPVYIDARTDEEKLTDEICYYVNDLSRVNGPFWNDELERAEIPLERLNLLVLSSKTINFGATEEDIRHLLSKLNFKVESCVGKDTKQLECYLIQNQSDLFDDMANCSTEDEDDNDAASGYESDGKCNNLLNGDDNWDDPPKYSEEAEVVDFHHKAALNLDVSSTSKQATSSQPPPVNSLVDSGYQKSPTNQDDDESPSSAVVPAALFTPFVAHNQQQSSTSPVNLSNILRVFQDVDKVNELDIAASGGNNKKYNNFNNWAMTNKEMVMKKKLVCEELLKNPMLAIAGPSRELKKKVTAKKGKVSAHQEELLRRNDEVRSITTCLLENTLNRIEDDHEQADLIQDFIPAEDQKDAADDEEHFEDAVEAVAAGVQPAVVENGDLANNNRDLEGNNYADREIEEVVEEVDNLEVNNVNNNEVQPEIENEIGQQNEEAVEEAVLALPDVEVAWSSREALFDVNSEVDPLDDFDMDGLVGQVATAVDRSVEGQVDTLPIEINGIVFDQSLVIVPTGNSGEHSDGSVLADLPSDDNGFPNWLLQIFEETDAIQANGHDGNDEGYDGGNDLHDEPHFYCQGDGLGVHPSTVDIDDDEDDDDDGNESDSESSSSSSSNDSLNDYENAENHLNDAEMLERENDLLNIVGAAIPLQNVPIFISDDNNGDGNNDDNNVGLSP